jgi:tetratricopeptide (TPR) repeat protein
MDRWPEALDAFDTAIAAEPRAATVHYHRARVLEELGRYPEAADAYQRSIRHDPGLREAYEPLAEVLARRKRRFKPSTKL